MDVGFLWPSSPPKKLIHPPQNPLYLGDYTNFFEKRKVEVAGIEPITLLQGLGVFLKFKCYNAT